MPDKVLFESGAGEVIRRFTTEETLKHYKICLDIFWIKDKSLADLDNLPSPDELADDIIENLQSALDS